MILGSPVGIEYDFALQDDAVVLGELVDVAQLQARIAEIVVFVAGDVGSDDRHQQGE